MQMTNATMWLITPPPKERKKPEYSFKSFSTKKKEGGGGWGRKQLQPERGSCQTPQWALVDSSKGQRRTTRIWWETIGPRDRPTTHTRRGENPTGGIWVSVSVLLCGFGYTHVCTHRDTQLIKTDQSSGEHTRQLSESVTSEASANKHRWKEAQVVTNFLNKEGISTWLHDGMHAVCTLTKLCLFTKPLWTLIRYGKELSYASQKAHADIYKLAH